MKKEPETRKIVSELYLMPATTVAMMMSAMPVSSYMPNVMLKRRKEKRRGGEKREKKKERKEKEKKREKEKRKKREKTREREKRKCACVSAS